MERNKKCYRGQILQRLEPYTYLLPVSVIFGIFIYYPLVRTIRMSVSVVNSMGRVVSFCGLKNFVNLFSAGAFWNSLFLTIRFAVMIVPAQIITGVFLGLLATDSKRKTNITRTIFAFPMAVSSACASIIWLLLFNPTTGLVNWVLGKSIDWLANGNLALLMVTVATWWLTMGMNFIYAYSGLQAIPSSLYEYSCIEGANYFQTLWYITLPSMSPTLFFLLIVNTIGAFQTFTQVKLMTLGGPANKTSVLSYSIYKEAFLNNRWGYASAQSIVFLLILLVISIIQFRTEKKGVFYQ
ncbi:sugar ABC transporter permease [Treponema lecithinolyticum]|uniref:carbohydrate ABC transporter permease n=1 Tax=Treponema lecithinolyticum TaxID=53418 RepID=UPI0028E9DA49|nr:sugar ABC transporter permease [Treponema lecithinolyticum]